MVFSRFRPHRYRPKQIIPVSSKQHREKIDISLEVAFNAIDTIPWRWPLTSLNGPLLQSHSRELTLAIKQKRVFALSAPTLSLLSPTTITSKQNAAVLLTMAISHCQDTCVFLASIFCGNPTPAVHPVAAAACLWQCTVRSSAQEAQPDSLGTLRASWPRGMLSVEVMKGDIRPGELPRLAVQVRR